MGPDSRLSLCQLRKSTVGKRAQIRTSHFHDYANSDKFDGAVGSNKGKTNN